MHNRCVIVGGGVWGQALARAICVGGGEVMMWNRTPKAGMTTDLAHALSFSRSVILAVSAQHVRTVITTLIPFDIKVCFLACKGIEQETGLLLSEVVHELLPTCDLGVLGGPNLAHEVAQGYVCGLTVAFNHHEVERVSQSLFASTCFIVETSSDVIGVQIAGAMKNVMAIGYGLLQQICPSENLWASYLVMAAKEVQYLIHALGGQTETMMSFAGLGDLILTSHSPKGRNSRFGRLWPHHDGGLVEGVATVKAVLKRAQTMGLNLPVTHGIHNILDQTMDLATWPRYLKHIA